MLCTVLSSKLPQICWMLFSFWNKNNLFYLASVFTKSGVYKQIFYEQKLIFFLTWRFQLFDEVDLLTDEKCNNFVCACAELNVLPVVVLDYIFYRHLTHLLLLFFVYSLMSLQSDSSFYIYHECLHLTFLKYVI